MILRSMIFPLGRGTSLCLCSYCKPKYHWEGKGISDQIFVADSYFCRLYFYRLNFLAHFNFTGKTFSSIFSFINKPFPPNVQFLYLVFVGKKWRLLALMTDNFDDFLFLPTYSFADEVQHEIIFFILISFPIGKVDYAHNK